MWQRRRRARNASAAAGEAAAARALRDELVERRRPSEVTPARRASPARGAQLQLELVGGLEAAVGGQQRVARGRAGVVDERVQLGDAPAEQQGGGERGVGRGGHARQSRNPDR